MRYVYGGNSNSWKHYEEDNVGECSVPAVCWPVGQGCDGCQRCGYNYVMVRVLTEIRAKGQNEVCKDDSHFVVAKTCECGKLV